MRTPSEMLYTQLGEIPTSLHDTQRFSIRDKHQSTTKRRVCNANSKFVDRVLEKALRIYIYIYTGNEIFIYIYIYIYLFSKR